MKKREGMKIGGLMNIGRGRCAGDFSACAHGDAPVYLCGLIPGLDRRGLLTYALVLAPQAE